MKRQVVIVVGAALATIGVVVLQRFLKDRRQRAELGSSTVDYLLALQPTITAPVIRVPVPTLQL